MGDRSQIYIKYDRDKLLAVQVKYALGCEFITRAFLYAEDVISYLKGKKELMIIDEDLLDNFFYNVYKGRLCLRDWRILFNHCNQCGKCFMEIQPDYTINYCFTDDNNSYPAGTQKCLDRKAYLQWCGEAFENDTENKGSESEALPARYSFMPAEGLKAFTELQYDMEGMYRSYLKQSYGI